jgi:hypothetical protein
LKSYEYISETKIDMLFDQLKKIKIDRESLLGVNLGVVKASIKDKKEDLPLNSPIEKLSPILKKLDDEKLIGDIEQPNKFIKGRFKLKFIVNTSSTDKENDIAFWGGIFNGVTIALIGSIGSLVGAKKNIDYNHNQTFYRVSLIEAAKDNATYFRETDNMFGKTKLDDAKVAVGMWLKDFEYYEYDLNDYDEYDFVAKVVLSDDNFILATPLYVAT